MKKIIFLSGEKDLRGGGELVLRDIIKEIKDDYKVLCVCKKGGDLADALSRYGAEILFCDLSWSRKFKNFYSNYRRLFYLYLKLKKISPHLIYATSGHINPFAVRLAKKLSIPVVTHVNDLFDNPRKDKFCFKDSNQIIACSLAVANLIREYNKNIKIINNSVDAKIFSPSLRFANSNFKNRLNLSNFFLVGNVSAITHKKGYFEFIEVAKELSKEIANIRFLITGEPKPEESYILTELRDKIEEYKLNDKVIFTGFLKDPESVLASLDVLLFPSYYEGFPRTIIEAFACKVPVVSAYWTGSEEVIKNTKDGFLFKIEDIKGMANAVLRLYKDKSLCKYITENAYKKFLEKFTMNKMLKEIKLVIDEKISENHKG